MQTALLAGQYYLSCPLYGPRDLRSSASVVDTETASSTNHLQYFNVSLYSWFRSGCATRQHLKLKPKPDTIHPMMKIVEDGGHSDLVHLEE